MTLAPDTPIRFLPRVGPAMAARLERLEIFTVDDLLYHVPFRYDDFSLVSPMARVQPGETVTVSGTVESFKNFFTKTGKKIQEAKVSDDSGRLTVVWFNQTYLRSIITPGASIRLSGTISWFGNKMVMNSPQYEIVEAAGEASLHTGRLVPIYPETEGVSSKWMRGRIALLLEEMLPALPEALPEVVIKNNHLLNLQTALASIHFPKTLDEAAEARRRLAFDELFMLQLRAYEERRIRQTTEQAYACDLHREDIASLVQSLPFALTGDQARSIEEILTDLARATPMNRLLVGDVGSGKTVVAAVAAYVAHRNGLQTVLMAPTQILAEQHYETISRLFNDLPIRVALVTAAHKNNESRIMNNELKNHNSLFPIHNSKFNIIVGTHALLSDNQTFSRLGLVIVDEQHRFGVAQRSQLTGKSEEGKHPHLLTMTATPIPRTLAKTAFGNVDLSQLAEMPKGRQKIKTWVVPEQKRTGAYDWMRKQLKDTGAQAFIICPLIEESETLTEVKAVKAEYERLKKIFPKFSLGLLHGKLKPKEKTEVLAGFRNKTFDILVATPVVEVGIDIPNATIMLIEAADRFGLGQLHQLRGRVGRGTLQSYCLLFTDHEDEPVLARLKAMETIHNGPELSEVDLKLRGPGELFGTRQHGAPHLRVGSFSDMRTIDETHRAVAQITKEDPDLVTFPLLRERLKNSTMRKDSQD